MLLDPLRASPQRSSIDWQLVDRLLPYGGIRIEDDVVCTGGAPENLTRDAFAAVSPS
jgi:Xaa-Pro dipeptidase